MVRVGGLITEDDVLIILSLLMRTLHFLASEAPNTRFVCKRVKLRTPYNEKMGVGQRLLWRRFPSKDQASEDGRTWDLPKCGLIEDALVSSQNYMTRTCTASQIHGVGTGTNVGGGLGPEIFPFRPYIPCTTQQRTRPIRVPFARRHGVRHGGGHLSWVCTRVIKTPIPKGRP